MAGPAQQDAAGRSRVSGKTHIMHALQTSLFFAALLAAWEFSVVYFNVKPYLIPRFSAVLVALWGARVELFSHSVVTLGEVISGYVSAVLVGGFLGVVIYSSAVAQRTLYPLITALQATPKSALAPVMIVWFGYGILSKSAMSFLFAFFPIVIATIGGFSGTAANLEEHFRALRANSWQTFAQLRLPYALPIFLDGCKVAMPLSVIGAMVGEFVGSQNGLGSFIMLAAGSSRTDLMFAAILVITVLSMILYSLLDWVSRYVWWRGIHV